MDERRRLPRYPYETSVVLEHNGNEVARGLSIDINTEAVQARFARQLPELGRFMIRLRLPDGKMLSSLVSLRWSTPQPPNSWLAALFFENLDNQSYKSIVDFGGQNWLRAHQGKILN